MTPASRRPAWWTVPNLVTAIRFALIAPIVALLLWWFHPLGAAMLAAFYGASDWMDGYLARKLDQVSRAGEILDPLADRLGIACIAAALAACGAVAWWTIAVFPAVDLIVFGAYLARRDRQLRVTWIGKARTAVAMGGFLVLMVGMAPGPDWVPVAGQAALACAAALHIGAGIGYLRQLLSRAPGGSTSRAPLSRVPADGGEVDARRRIGDDTPDGPASISAEHRCNCAGAPPAGGARSTVE